MLQSFSPSHDWFSDSEPLLFDEELCQSLMQSIPTPPQSPPLKTDLSKALSKVDQLELVSDFLLEDKDFLHLTLNYGFMPDAGATNKVQADSTEDSLWHIGEKALDKISALSTSPLLSDIDTSIFEEIAGSTLECHDASLENKYSEDPLSDSLEQNETSDYGSLSAEGDLSSSDSEEEIDVVTVRRSSTRSHHCELQQEERRREQLRALKRCHLEIQQQHNYAAPRPSSPVRTDSSPSSALKRSRLPDLALYRPVAIPGRSRGAPLTRHCAELEDEEERRRTHNVMERQRRNELKNCFLRLRDHVPELSNNDKASKVIILKRARDSIRSLEVESKRLGSKKDKLMDRHDWLKARLEQLRRI